MHRAVAAAVVSAGALLHAEDDKDATTSSDPAGTATEEIIVVAAPVRDQDQLTIHMDAETLQRVPGVNDDPLSVLATLPGVAVNNDIEGGLAVRGARPGDNGYRVDFLDVGYLFHFGTGSVVDGDLVEGFAFHPAGYGARYQGVIGSAVDVRTRAPRRDGMSVLLDANLIQTGLMVEGPVTPHQRGYLSARASYYDLVLEPYLSEINDEESDDVDVVQLPRFRDYRGRYQLDVGASGTLDILADGATDNVELLFHDQSTETLQDPALAGAHRFALDYDRIGMVYTSATATQGVANGSQHERWLWQAGWSRNATGFRARLGGAGDVDTQVVDNTVRVEGTSSAGDRFQLATGLTYSSLQVDYDVLLRDTGCTQFEVDCRFSDADPVATRNALSLARLAAFLEGTIWQSDADTGVALTTGVGYMTDDYLREERIDPRLRLEWRPRSLPGTTLTLAAGRYHQVPAFEYIEQALGNPDLSYLESEHYVVSLKHRFARGWLVRLDAYRKESSNLVTANDRTRYDNRGVGMARGLELLVQGALGPRLFGWAALSYAKATRTDLDTGATFDFEYDQPLIASAVAKYRLNDHVSLSGRAWFHSGPPHTPILGGELDPTTGDFLPIYGKVNSERLPSFFRLDFRADWRPARWTDLGLYAELVNATNRRNVAGYEYAADYSSREAITQIPLFVSVGVRKQWQ